MPALLISACSVEDNNQEVTQSQTEEKTISNVEAPAKKEKRPNFLLIVTDDLGYSDLGVFGGEIGTPNLDALAASGTQITNFHTAVTCSPTRSMLLTGMDNHLAGVGAMFEAKGLMKIPPEYANSPGYAGHLNNRVAVLPEILKSAGYRTYMSGKWHLGKGEDQSPNARGFEKTFTLLEGGAGHLSNMSAFPSRDNRNHALYRKNGEMTDLPEDFYSTEFYANNLINYLQEDRESEKPFFAYLTFTAPHWPLQAPAESIARYKGKYDEGYEAFFEKRIARQKELGLIDQSETGQELLDAKPWADLNEEEQRRQAKTMEIYAAMVNDIDIYVGKVIQTLKDIGEYENTVIFFMSDNGADHQTLSFIPGFDEYQQACCDLSTENMGAENSYVFLEAGWARVSGAPSRFFKSYTTQGGILSPAILSYPKAEKAVGRYSEFLSVMDVTPTFLDLAGVSHPAPTFQGREVLPMKGASFSSILDGEQEGIHAEDYVMGWELHYHRAIRKGDWKITYSRPPLGDNTWKLYDLSTDPFEHHDLSAQQPEKLAELLQEWDKYVEENNVYVPQ
jgi:arylsulfatase